MNVKKTGHDEKSLHDAMSRLSEDTREENQ